MDVTRGVDGNAEFPPSSGDFGGYFSEEAIKVFSKIILIKPFFWDVYRRLSIIVYKSLSTGDEIIKLRT